MQRLGYCWLQQQQFCIFEGQEAEHCEKLVSRNLSDKSVKIEQPEQRGNYSPMHLLPGVKKGHAEQWVKQKVRVLTLSSASCLAVGLWLTELGFSWLLLKTELLPICACLVRQRP